MLCKFVILSQVKNRTVISILLPLVFLAALSLFAYLAFETIHQKEYWFDISIYRMMPAGAEWIKFMKAITFFGDTWFLFTAYCLLIGYYLLKKRYRYSIAIFSVSFGAWLLSKTLKLLFHRGRPDISLITKPTDYSFPSGHALTSFVFCSILTWLLWQTNWKNWMKWLFTILLLLFTLSIGASRIVLSVHFASDVVGGFALGIMWMIVGWVFWRRRLVSL